MSNPFQLAMSLGDFLLRKRLKHLIVHVTNHCNFRCEHCFVDFGTNKRDLPAETFQRLAQDAGSLFWLDIGGGEPFIRKDLADIVGAFKAPKIIHIPSNGSLLPQMLKQLREIEARQPHSELVLGLSLDGLAETHDRLRGEPGNFEQVWKTFAAIRELSPAISIKITTVINNMNFHEILPLMREVQSRGVDFHSVILLRGDPPNPEMRLPDLSELHAIGPEIFGILNGYSYGRSRISAHLLRNYHRYLWNVSLATLEQHTQVIPCYASRSHMVVWGDGDVSSCEMLPAVGNLREESLPEILAGDKFKEQARSIRDKECHCTHNCALLTSILFNPTSLPHLAYQRVTA